MNDKWSSAPDWANFLAMDLDGTWWWFRERPTYCDGYWWTPAAAHPEQMREAVFASSRTLESKP